jgi:hypothetical protein
VETRLDLFYCSRLAGYSDRRLRLRRGQLSGVAGCGCEC